VVPYSVYLHIPFCTHRCGYCDFNTYAGLEDLIPAYVGALCREIALLGESAGQRLPVHTVFFGGGTPSLLPPAELRRILEALGEAFELLSDVEVTLEANPGTVTRDTLSAYRSLGVNRLSLGMQSASPEELRILEREHSVFGVIQAVKAARQAGFENLNLDLIFGLPGQLLAGWQRSLELALGLGPEHLSLYALTVEHGTPLSHWVGRGLLPEPDPDLAADMYEWAAERLEQAGFGQYEISNWARRDGNGGLRACRHNLQYWRNQPYLGLGAGAHGYAGGFRVANVLVPAAYIQRLREGGVQPFPRTPAAASATPIDRAAEIGETMMMGLRLTSEGVSARAFGERFGVPLGELFAKPIDKLTRQGLLEWTGERLRLTERGKLLGNRVFVEFI
jgi:oxygen-independent coproporphyrinogen-3 oxidase